MGEYIDVGLQSSILPFTLLLSSIVVGAYALIAFEPKIALDGGLEGISEIRKIINKSSELIKIGGKLILEIAFDQKIEVLKLLKDKGFYINKTLKDLAKNDRCIISTKT
tara:strand:+ start:77 stop:403 length:327 start_codon:yes stop_codon:yes gene_type:complete